MEWSISSERTILTFRPLPLIKPFWLVGIIQLGMIGLVLLTMILVTILYNILQRLISLSYLTEDGLSTLRIKQIEMLQIFSGIFPKVNHPTREWWSCGLGPMCLRRTQDLVLVFKYCVLSMHFILSLSRSLDHRNNFLDMEFGS